MRNEIGRIGSEQVKRDAEIPSAIHDIECRISDLQNEVRALIERLSPVMRGAVPTPEDPGKCSSAQCELGNIITGQARRVESIARDVREACGRLEI